MKYIAIFIIFLSCNCFSINCKLASSKVEIAICSNKDLLELDGEMSKIYRRMSFFNRGNKNVLRSQLSWISSREECSSHSNPNECIRLYTKNRIAELIGKEALNGTEQYFVNIVGENYYGEDYSKYSFSYPIITSPQKEGEKVFNREMEKAHTPKDDKQIRYSISKNCEWSHLDTNYNVLFTNSQYLEIGFYYSSMVCGAAHPNHGSENRHFDVNKGKFMSSADIIIPANLDGIYSNCIRRLAESQERELHKYESEYGDSIKRNISDVANWIIYPHSASIVFAPYVAASYAEGTQTCNLSKEELRESLTNYMLQLLNP